MNLDALLLGEVSESNWRTFFRIEGAALLVEPPGLVTRMNRQAKSVLARRAGSTATDLLGLDMSALVAEARDACGLSLRIDRRCYTARVDPIDSLDGRLIGLLVFLEEASAARTSRRPQRSPRDVDAFATMFSRDETLDAALTWAQRLARSAVPVLLLAETGTGKELVARALHAASPRSSGPFVPVNCGAIAPSLLESELFGYGPSAFTGADRAGRNGLFAVAASGTLFLDEVAEMPLAMQSALLRVLEDGTYRRVGETVVRQADARILSATGRGLKAMVDAGTFRRDLFYRLKGATVSLPPLRARSDRAALAAHLLDQLARTHGYARAPSLSGEVLAVFDRHPWPGNVRELRAVLEVALLVAEGAASIEPGHLPPELRFAGSASPSVNAAASADATDLAFAEKSTVRRVLADVGGNVSRAAKRLGVARSTLYRMMQRHGLLS